MRGRGGVVERTGGAEAGLRRLGMGPTSLGAGTIPGLAARCDGASSGGKPVPLLAASGEAVAVAPPPH
jgi:hypothetical protein